MFNNNSTMRNIIGAGLLSLMLIGTGCAGITDAGVTQEAPVDQPDPQTEHADQNKDGDIDHGPFSNDDGPGVIYDEPEL